jgi:hypothetical protein
MRTRRALAVGSGSQAAKTAKKVLGGKAKVQANERQKSIDRKNLGIIGNVNAGAVAVGANSRAIVHSVSDACGRAEFDRALEELRNQLSQLQFSETSHQVIREDVVDKLKELGAQEQSGACARCPHTGEYSRPS